MPTPNIYIHVTLIFKRVANSLLVVCLTVCIILNHSKSFISYYVKNAIA